MVATIAWPSTATGSFVGREGEIEQLLSLRAVTRVLTLVGPGGIGKSRLAHRFSGVVEHAYADGVFVVSMGGLIHPVLVPGAVGEALGVRPANLQTWVEALVGWLTGRHVLLVFDDCERHIAECAELADHLLRACPALQIVCTSREPLGIDGEVVWRVPPLSLPSTTAATAVDLCASDAVRLLITRIQERAPEFALNDENGRALAHICRRLRGLPLAIEVVATHVPRLGLSGIAARVDAPSVLSLTGVNDLPPRHLGMRASLDWSYALLTDRERLLLWRLTVFAGGWTLDAAEAVCADDARLPVARVAGLLDRLVNKSLVVADHPRDSARYRFAEFVHQYAAELVGSAREAASLRRRHAAHLLRLATRVHPARLDADQAARVEGEQANFRAALHWAIRTSEVQLAMRLAIAGYAWWYRAGRFGEGHAWLTRCLGLPLTSHEHREWRALIGCLAGHLGLLAGDGRSARALLQEAREAHIGLGDHQGVALAAHFQSLVELWSGNPRGARVWNDECRASLQRVPFEGEVTRLLQSALPTAAARIASELGEHARAARLADEAATRARGHHSRFWLARALTAQSVAATHRGEHRLARWLVDRAIDLQRAERDTEGLIDSLCVLGQLNFGRHHEQEGLSALVEAARLAQDTGERLGLVWAMEAAARGVASAQPEVAVRLSGVSDALREKLGFGVPPGYGRRARGWLSRARDALTARTYATARAEGRTLPHPRAVSLIGDLARGPLPSAQEQNQESLTQREREIVELLVRGMSNPQIAFRLSISVGTVRSHVDHILSKLGVHSRAQVAVWALNQRPLFS
jgi:predicted ATPase/DNA-binding CsgD family transcriptional regulator